MAEQKYIINEKIRLSNNVDQLKDSHKNLERYKEFNDKIVELNKAVIREYEASLNFIGEAVDKYTYFIDTYKIDLDLFNNALLLNEKEMNLLDNGIFLAKNTIYIKNVQKEGKDLDYCINNLLKELKKLNCFCCIENNNNLKSIHYYDVNLEKDAKQYSKKLNNFDISIQAINKNFYERLQEIKQIDVNFSYYLHTNKSTLEQLNSSIHDIFILIDKENLGNITIPINKLDYTENEVLTASRDLTNQIYLISEALNINKEVMDIDGNLSIGNQMVRLFEYYISKAIEENNTDQEVLDYFCVGQNRGYLLVCDKVGEYVNSTEKEDAKSFVNFFGKEGTKNIDLILKSEEMDIIKKRRGVYEEE